MSEKCGKKIDAKTFRIKPNLRYKTLGPKNVHPKQFQVTKSAKTVDPKFLVEKYFWSKKLGGQRKAGKK